MNACNIIVHESPNALKITCCFNLQLRPSSSLTSCREEFECFSPSPLYSPTNSYLKLTDVSKRSPQVSQVSLSSLSLPQLTVCIFSPPLQPFSKVSISAKSTVPFQILHLLVSCHLPKIYVWIYYFGVCKPCYFKKTIG